MADLIKLQKFERLSPFEIKDELIQLAKKTSRTTRAIARGYRDAFAASKRAPRS